MKGSASALSETSYVDQNCSSCCKRLAKCSRPPPPNYSSFSAASWLNDDMWLLIMKFLGPVALVRLAVVNRALHRLVMAEKSVWKTACHRDLNVPYDAAPRFGWRHLYASAVDGSHAYTGFQDSYRHKDWIRIGSFQVVSGNVLATGDVSGLSFSVEETTNEDLGESVAHYASVISNVQTGSWIAGTMQVLDARYWELFLHEEYQKGDWTHQEVEERIILPPCDVASVGIVDFQSLKRKSTKDLLRLNSWNFPPGIFFPATAVTMFAAAASANLTENQCDSENEGLVVKVYVMKAGKDGAVVSIRITQCLAPGQAAMRDDEQLEREVELPSL